MDKNMFNSSNSSEIDSEIDMMILINSEISDEHCDFGDDNHFEEIKIKCVENKFEEVCDINLMQLTGETQDVDQAKLDS